jgi:hypothetical protein
MLRKLVAAAPPLSTLPSHRSNGIPLPEERMMNEFAVTHSSRESRLETQNVVVFFKTKFLFVTPSIKPNSRKKFRK